MEKFFVLICCLINISIYGFSQENQEEKGKSAEENAPKNFVNNKEEGQTQKLKQFVFTKETIEEMAEAWTLVKRIQDVSQWSSIATSSYVVSLWKFKNPQVARVLIDALPKSPPLVQHYMIEKLGELRTHQALGKLISIAKQGNPWWVRTAAIVSLGKIRNVCAVPVLLDCLNDTEELMVPKRSIVSLYQITGEGENIPLDADKIKTTEAIDFWKIWGERKRKEYEMIPVPHDDIPYIDFVSRFQIIKPSKLEEFETEVESDEEKRLSFQFSLEKERIFLMVWAEKDTSGAISLDALLPFIESIRKRDLTEFQRKSWKSFEHKEWKGYRLSYQGIKNGEKFGYTIVVFRIRGNLFYILLRTPLEKKRIGNIYLKELLQGFTILENK